MGRRYTPKTNGKAERFIQTTLKELTDLDLHESIGISCLQPTEACLVNRQTGIQLRDDNRVRQFSKNHRSLRGRLIPLRDAIIGRRSFIDRERQ
jgi:transposase InsO family protein